MESDGEVRESNVGLFRSSGEVRPGLVKEIIWEARFIKLPGANVNLGNYPTGVER